MRSQNFERHGMYSMGSQAEVTVGAVGQQEP